MRSERWIRCAALLLVVCTIAGCAAKQAFREGERRMRRQDYDQAVLDYSRAVALKPSNSRYSVALSRAKLRSEILYPSISTILSESPHILTGTKYSLM